MKKINILHVTQYLEIGGLETLIVELCKRADKSVFQVQVLCLNGYDSAYVESLKKSEIRVSLIKKRTRFDLHFFKRIVRFFQKEKIDIVHAHGGVFFYSVICSKIAGVKKILFTAHGMPLSKNIQFFLEDYVSIIMADAIISVSSEIEDFYTSTYPTIKQKIHMILNGVDTSRFEPSSQNDDMMKKHGLPGDKIIMGTVGRLEKIKNYNLILKSLKEINKLYGKIACLVFIGRGSQFNRLKNSAKELGILDQVYFLGMQYNIEKLLPILDVFVLSSLTEGTSISLLEAQSCGIPAVVTNVGGNSKIVKNGYNGFLCKSNDYDDMVEKLGLLLLDENLRKKMKKHSRDLIVKNFSLTKMVGAHEILYKNLLGFK